MSRHSEDVDLVLLSTSSIISKDATTGVQTTVSMAEMTSLDGVTAGTVTASKAVIVDANKDIATFRNVTLSGNIVQGSTTISETDIAKIDGITNGTQAANKAVVADANVNTGVSKVTALHIGASGSETQVLATAAEINSTCDVSTRIVNATAATLTVTEADHSGKIIVLDLATGIAVTLPAASAGLKFRFIIKTTFTGAASIKSVTGADIMIGYALMGNDTDNTIVRWPVIAADTADTIDMFGTANSTGGMAGQEIEIEGLATNLWFVKIVGDAAGTEATPFANTVA